MRTTGAESSSQLLAQLRLGVQGSSSSLLIPGKLLIIVNQI